MKKIICPHCYSDEGIYIKTQIYGSAEVYFNNDGSYDELGANTAMHDSLTYKYGKNAYCSECRKYIGRVKDLGLNIYE